MEMNLITIDTFVIYNIIDTKEMVNAIYAVRQGSTIVCRHSFFCTCDPCCCPPCGSTATVNTSTNYPLTLSDCPLEHVSTMILAT